MPGYQLRSRGAGRHFIGVRVIVVGLPSWGGLVWISFGFILTSIDPCYYHTGWVNARMGVWLPDQTGCPFCCHALP